MYNEHVGAAPPKPVVPDRVGGFPVDFLRQVVSLVACAYMLYTVHVSVMHARIHAHVCAHTRLTVLYSTDAVVKAVISQAADHH